MSSRTDQLRTYEISLKSQDQEDNCTTQTQNEDFSQEYCSKLDKEYEVEKVTLARWVAYKLGYAKLDMILDYSDGLTLIKLVEKLSSKIINSIESNPKLQCQKLNNLKLMLLFLESEEGFIFPQEIGAEEILLGDAKAHHELIWSLVLHYSLRRANIPTLLDMVNHIISPNRVANFTTDWVGGKVLQTLVLFLSKANVNLASDSAFEMTFMSAVSEAERLLTIPPLITQEMLSSLSQKSLIVYLSFFITPFLTLLNTWLYSQLPTLKIPEQLEEWLDGCYFQTLLNHISPILTGNDVLSSKLKRDIINYKREQDQIDYFTLAFKNIEKIVGVKCKIDPVKLVERRISELDFSLYIYKLREKTLVPKLRKSKRVFHTSDSSSCISSLNNLGLSKMSSCRGVKTKASPRSQSEEYIDDLKLSYSISSDSNVFKFEKRICSISSELSQIAITGRSAISQSSIISDNSWTASNTTKFDESLSSLKDVVFLNTQPSDNTKSSFQTPQHTETTGNITSLCQSLPPITDNEFIKVNSNAISSDPYSANLSFPVIGSFALDVERNIHQSPEIREIPFMTYGLSCKKSNETSETDTSLASTSSFSKYTTKRCVVTSLISTAILVMCVVLLILIAITIMCGTGIMC